MHATHLVSPVDLLLALALWERVRVTFLSYFVFSNKENWRRGEGLV